MFKSKTLALFLLKAVVIYALLALPLSFYDQLYGDFYRKIAGSFFNTFRETGLVRFKEGAKPEITHINIGNKDLPRGPGGAIKTLPIDINTRYLGYLPTILLISLVVASPVPWKRKLMALALGLALVTLLILFKQYISLLWRCDQNPWLQLTDYGDKGKALLNSTYHFIAVTSSSVLYFVVAIWLLVTFRLDDFLNKIVAETGLKQKSPVRRK